MKKNIRKFLLSYIFAVFLCAGVGIGAEYDQLDDKREKLEAQRNKATQQIKKINYF